MSARSRLQGRLSRRSARLRGASSWHSTDSRLHELASRTTELLRAVPEGEYGGVMRWERVSGSCMLMKLCGTSSWDSTRAASRT